MGREVRRVPPNWEHPRDDKGHYEVMYETSYKDAVAEWINNHQLWLEGKHPDQLDEKPEDDYKPSKHKYYAQWDGDCPEVKYYNTYYTKEEATWYQMYETVSEGTPVSPPFATKEELAQYLAENGDFWYQSDIERGLETFRTKPTLEQARNLVDAGWAMSFMGVETQSGDKYLLDPYQQQEK